MGSYFARRAGVALVQLVGLALIAFSLIHLVPGNPVQEMLGTHATPHNVATVSARLGLNRSLVAQFGSFISGVVTAHGGTPTPFGHPFSSPTAGRFAPRFFLFVWGPPPAVVSGG